MHWPMTVVALSTHGVNTFDNLVLFAPAAEDYLGTLDAGPVVDFIRQGGNLLAAAASSDQGAGGTSWLLHELALQCGVVLAEDGTSVVLPEQGTPQSQACEESDKGSGDCGVADNPTPKSLFKTSHWTQHESGNALMAGNPSSPITYQGIALAPADSTSQRHMTILSAPAEAFSVDASGNKVNPFPRSSFASVDGTKTKNRKKKRNKGGRKRRKQKQKTHQLKGTGDEPLALVLGVETQISGSRIVFLGSIDMCTDAVYESHKNSGNEEFCNAVGSWAFQEAGVVRADSPLSIVASGQSDELRRFQLNDSVVVTAVFHADGMQVGSDDAPGEAVQLELMQGGQVKQKVFMRQNKSDKGKFSVELTFREKDAFGVFHLRAVHRRMGWTTVELVEQVVVEPVLAKRRLDQATAAFCVIFAALYFVNH